MQELNIHRFTTQVDIDTEERAYHLPIASDTTLGGIKVGDNLTIEEDGTLNAEATEYQLPTASASTLGGIKVGSNLQINDGILTAKVDTSLSSTSLNPVANSILNTSITNLTSSIQSINNTIGTINNTLSSLSDTVSGCSSTIEEISETVNTHTSEISDNTDNIETNATNISSLTDTVGTLSTRVSTAEGKITTLEATSASLIALLDDEQTYSYLLPVSTWTGGSITLEKRGKIGTLYIDIEGDLTLASAASSIIFSYTDLNLYLPASAALVSDDGLVLGKVDDETNNFTLENISAHSLHITKVKGSIPLVFF